MDNNEKEDEKSKFSWPEAITTLGLFVAIVAIVWIVRTT